MHLGLGSDYSKHLVTQKKKKKKKTSEVSNIKTACFLALIDSDKNREVVPWTLNKQDSVNIEKNWTLKIISYYPENGMVWFHSSVRLQKVQMKWQRMQVLIRLLL